MQIFSQEGRAIAVATPLGEDELVLTSFQGVEEMSRPFRFELEMLSDRESIEPETIVGKNVSFYVRRPDGELRYFNGYVNRFAFCGKGDRGHMYRATVVPWLWFLTRSSDCRIFQQMTVPDIIEKVFRDFGFTDFKMSMSNTYPVREFCVQYSETAFDFVSRLMEEYGIFYFFEHENGKHTLHIADKPAGYLECVDSEAQMPSTVGGEHWTDNLFRWEHAHLYRSGKTAGVSFDFEHPASTHRSMAESLLKLDNVDKFELYEYPGVYEKHTTGDDCAKLRMEEEESTYDMVLGESVCRSFSPGFKFKVAAHHNRNETGKAWVLTKVEHKVELGGAYISGADVPDIEYINRFECVPDTIAFRPPRRTPAPRIQGVQTAIVVGPRGEEILTDKHGRVRVHFHWDRYNEASGSDESGSSCWVRVAQHWAGAKWGTVFTPRIGHEVIVEFLDGDPDRPIITGRVYNGDNNPPYELPKNATISGIKTRSSKGGDGETFNELRFDDTKDEEQVFLHAQKNLDIRVENDRFETIENDRHLVIEHDKFEHVKNDRSETIDRHHKEKIKGDRNLNVGGKEAKEVDKSLTLVVKDDVAEEFKKNHSMVVSKDSYIKASNIVIEASTNITIKVGGSYIAIESGGIKIGTSGDIELESGMNTTISAGMDLKQDAGMNFDAKGGMNATVEGSMNGTLKGGIKAELNGSATAVVKGGVVMIN